MDPHITMELRQLHEKGIVSLKDNPDFLYLKAVLTALQQDLPSVQRLFPTKSLQWKKLLCASLQASLQEVLFTTDAHLQQQALQRLHLWLTTRIHMDTTPTRVCKPAYSCRIWEEQLLPVQTPQFTRSSTKLRPILPPLSHISDLNRTSPENKLTSDSFQPLRHYLHKRLAESTKRTRTMRLGPLHTPLRSRIGRNPSPDYTISRGISQTAFHSSTYIDISEYQW